METTIKLKDDVEFSQLEKLGFVEDSANCEKGDHYYHLNNYYFPIKKDFRITVNMLNRHIDVLCLAGEKGLYNIFTLKPLYDLLTSNMVEVKTL